MVSGLSANIGKVLRIDLTVGRIWEEKLDEASLRMYVGGTGLGSRFLYDEVKPGTQWNDPENRLVLASGPLGGAKVAGSGSYSVVTKGPLTNGATSTQANGYFGAYLKFSGFDAVIIQGKANTWKYLHIHDGTAELLDATHIVGMDTWETESQIKKELGMNRRSLSVVGIGPAGENLVRFAAIVGDEGHVAAHNGVGAVMGAKKLKAVAAARGRAEVKLYDAQKVLALGRQMIEDVKKHETYKMLFNWGNSHLYPIYAASGVLPVKNMTTNLFPEAERFSAEYYRPRSEVKNNPCWSCPSHHCSIIKVTEGPYAGYVGEEPEYECWAAFSSMIGQTDVGAALMLNDVTDRLGFDGNETGWLLGFTMECYEKGVITEKDTDGLQMNWGNVENARELLFRIARRQGFGNVLAEGVMRAAHTIGGEALNCAVYMKKGHAPRGHDHRARWGEILDYAVSGTGTIETGPILGLDQFSPDSVALTLASEKSRFFVDSLVMCMFPTMTMGSGKIGHLVEILNAATGWDYSEAEARKLGHRISNLLRVFNLRHGVLPDTEAPSIRYGSAPVDGPARGQSIMPHWNKMLDQYYQHMGWDRSSGRPRPETLREVGLENLIPDIW